MLDVGSSLAKLTGTYEQVLVSDPSFVATLRLLKVKYIQFHDEETLDEALLTKRICVLDNKVLQINKNHKYHFKVQYQTFVTNKTWANFVVKSSSGSPLFTERGFFDKEV